MSMHRSLIAFALALSACSSSPRPSPASADASTPPDQAHAATQCKGVDTSEAPEILTYEEGGVRVHTFVAPHISARTATHIIETPESLVVIDTQMLRDYAAAFRDYADGLGKPIELVIVSHGHPDHYFGLESFEDRPTTALAQTHEHMAKRQRFHLRMHREVEQECDAVTDRVRMPAQTLEAKTATIGGVEFLFEVVDRAEDDVQLVVEIPQAKTLVLQDLMATDTHGFTAGGMLDHWIEVLEGYRHKSEYTHVLAGHGRPVDLAGIDTMIDYLRGSEEVFAAAQDAEDFVELMNQRFPDKSGEYLLELMATIKWSE